jgi:hypothetical protein
MEVVVERGESRFLSGKGVSLAKAGRLLARIFGCWHLNMSRPVTRDGQTYRACADCGARRRFDTERWETVGQFYYPARPEPGRGW